jgi:hypothetical protein
MWSHATVCAILVFVLVLAPQHMKYETLVPSAQWLFGSAAAAAAIGIAVFLIIRRWGIPQVCNATLIPVFVALIFLLGFHGKELDINYSARPLAREIERQAPGLKPLALLDVKRDMDYGLAFYRNESLIHYSTDGVPAGEHLLVIRTRDANKLDHWLSGRIYKSLFLYDSQGLEVYRVYAQP